MHEGDTCNYTGGKENIEYSETHQLILDNQLPHIKEIKMNAISHDGNGNITD